MKKATVMSPGLAAERYRASFERDGYVLVQLFDETEAQRLRSLALAAISDPTPAPQVERFAASDEPLPHLDPTNPLGVYKILNTPLQGVAWFDLVLDHRIVRLVVDLLGPDLDFVMGFMKMRPTRLQLDEGWHRDYDSERHQDERMLTALIYVDDMSSDAAGPTQLIPGTHRNVFDSSTHGTAPIQVDGDEVQLASAPAGAVLFLHSLTAHSAGVNLSATNKSIILHEYRHAGNHPMEPMPFAFNGLPVARQGRRLAWTQEWPC